MVFSASRDIRYSKQSRFLPDYKSRNAPFISTVMLNDRNEVQGAKHPRLLFEPPFTPARTALSHSAASRPRPESGEACPPPGTQVQQQQPAPAASRDSRPPAPARQTRGRIAAKPA